MYIPSYTVAVAAACFWLGEGRVTSLRLLGRATLGYWVVRACAAGPARLPRLGAGHGGLLLRLALHLLHRGLVRRRLGGRRRS